MKRRSTPQGAAARSRAARWLLRAFGVLLVVAFGAAGVDVAQDLWRNLRGAHEARAWRPVPARLIDWQLLSVDAASIRGFAFRRPSHGIAARYAYRVDGVEHVGTRVGFAPATDNFSDDWRRPVLRRLQAAAAGAALTVWVDPADATRSVVEPALPLQRCVFDAAFLLFPCGVASALLLGTLLRGRGGAAGDARNRRWLLPLWATLHGLPVLPIVALAAPGSIGWRSGLVLALLGAVGLAGAAGLGRAAFVRYSPSPPGNPRR